MIDATSTPGQFFRFCVVGVANTLVDIVAYYLLTRVFWTFQDSISFYKAISYVIATICSFTLNRRWTFSQTTAVTIDQIIKFYSTVGLGIFLNVGVQHVAVYVFGFYDLVGVIIASGVTAIWGFLFSKLYVFKN